MALPRLHVWIFGEVLFASDLNAEFNNYTNNALTLISPLTGSLDVNGQDLTAIDEVAFSNAGAGASVAGRLRRNGTALTWHNGTSAVPVLTGTGGSGDTILVVQMFS